MYTWVAKSVSGRFWPFWFQTGYGFYSLVLNRAVFLSKKLYFLFHYHDKDRSETGN